MAYGAVTKVSTGHAVGAEGAMQKRLSLKEVARQFEQGKSLEEYRTVNLCETSDQLLQQTLAEMPKGRSLMESLLKVAQQLQGRAAGRNRDDAALIVDGLQELQTQWQSHEESAKQAAKELTENAAASPSPARFQARNAQLQEECAILRTQVAEKDAVIEQLRQSNQDLQKSAASNPDEKAAAPQQEQPAVSSAAEATSPSLLQSLRITGSPELGSTLQMDSGGHPLADTLPLQWLRRSPADADPVVISGAVRSQYSPEPADVGCNILCRVGVASPSGCEILNAKSPVATSPGLDEEVAQLAQAESTEFCIVPVQHNGQVATKRMVAILRVTQQRVSITANGKDIASAAYHADMQVCGARGGGDGAAQGMFLAISGQHVFMLALETPKKRNICIKLLREIASKQNVQLDGPQDTS